MPVLTDFFKKLLGAAPAKAAKSATSVNTAAPAEKVTKPHMTEYVVFGDAGRNNTVRFVDESRGINRKLVDEAGNILHFPSIEKEKFWTKKLPANALAPRIRYRSSFEKRQNGWIFFWCVQPDGRYWGDEGGFGMEHGAEIELYARLDENGKYTGPFRLYEIDDCCYAPDERLENQHYYTYAASLETLKAGKATAKEIDILFPRIRRMDCSRDEYFTILGEKQAAACWANSILRAHLLEATEALMEKNAPILEIVRYPSHKWIHSCLTLFARVTDEPIFRAALDKFYAGQSEPHTVKWLELQDKAQQTKT